MIYHLEVSAMVKTKLQSIIFMLLLCSLCAGCMPRHYGPKVFPIEDPSKPIEFQGFSILPPQGGAWKIADKTQYNAMIGKDAIGTKKGPHTFVAMVRTFTIENDFDKKEDFLQYFKKKLEESLDPRFTLKKSDVRLHERGDALCVKYDQLSEDRGVPGFQDSVFQMDLHCIACRHPDNPKMIIDVGYSQRVPPGADRVPMEAEGEPYLNRLRFTPLKRPFVTAMIDVGTSPQLISAGHGSIWLAVRDIDSVVRIDPKTNKLTSTIKVGGKPGGVLSTEDAVWVSNMLDDTISKIDPTSGEMKATIKTGRTPIFMAAGFGSIWVVNNGSDTVSRINQETNRVDATIKVGKAPMGIAIGKDSLWVGHAGDKTISRIDPKTNSVIDKDIYAGKEPSDLLFLEDSVWVATFADNTVARINPETSMIADSIPVGRGPNSLTVAKGLLWVLNQKDATVMGIDPKNGKAVGNPIPVGNSPTSIHYYEGALWVAIFGEGRVYRIDL